MKFTNLIALPFGLVADAVTLGEAGVTRKIFNDERDERQIEAIRAIADALKAKKENQ